MWPCVPGVSRASRVRGPSTPWRESAPPRFSRLPLPRASAPLSMTGARAVSTVRQFWRRGCVHIHLCFSEHVVTLRRTRGTCPHSHCAGPVPMSNVRLRLQHVPAGARRRPLPTHRSGCDAPSRRGFVSASPTAGCVERLLVSSSSSCASSLEKRLARLFSSL